MNTASFEKCPWTYTIEEYEAILKDRTKLRRPAVGRIAVIGAGISGLIAGTLLKRAGHRVTIFEAKHTVGGRIKTLRERFTSGFHAEAGAMRVPSHHKLTNFLINEVFHLPTIPFEMKSKAGLIYVNDERKTWGEYEADPAGFRFSLRKDEPLAENEKGLISEQLFEICVENHVRREHPHFKIKMLRPTDSEFLPQDQLKKILDEFDQYSLRQFLTQIARLDGKKTGPELTKRARDMIYAIEAHEMQMSSSMAAVIGQYVALHADTYIQIRRGMDELPKAFLRGSKAYCKGIDDPFGFPELDGSLSYNSRVVEIADNPPGLRVHFRNTITAHEQDDFFDRVIMCIPFSALRHIQMLKLTSPNKRRAIRQLHYVNACKILLEFSHKFWEEEMVDRPPIKGGHSITDLPIRHIYYPSPGQNENDLGRGLILASYTWGDDSLRWTSLKPEDRIRFALRDLARVHDIPDGLERSCIGGMSHSWAEDEFTSGAFAHFEPGQLTNLFADVWLPENGIHYAGEHTSTKHAWIEGAVESGIRVAREVCDFVAADA